MFIVFHDAAGGIFICLLIFIWLLFFMTPLVRFLFGYCRSYASGILQGPFHDASGVLQGPFHDAAGELFVCVKLTRILSQIFHCIRTLTGHTNTTYRCHKPTALGKEVTSNFLDRETYDCISNVPSLIIWLLPFMTPLVRFLFAYCVS